MAAADGDAAEMRFGSFIPPRIPPRVAGPAVFLLSLALIGAP
jgi:hypothetical protein